MGFLFDVGGFFSLVGALLGNFINGIRKKFGYGFRHRRYVYRLTLSSSHFWIETPLNDYS